MNNSQREPVWVERALDGELSQGDWLQFEELAGRDASQWESLARELVDELALRRALRPMHERIAASELPDAASGRGPGPSSRSWFRHPALGWAAALLISIALWWSGSAGDRPQPSELASNAAEAAAQLEPLLQPANSEEAFSHYVRAGLQEGRFVQELPRLVLDTQPLDGDENAVEVVYVRRLVERTVMNQLVQVGLDDGGELQPVAVPATRLLNHGSY